MPVTRKAPYVFKNGEPILMTMWDAKRDNDGKKFKRDDVIKKIRHKMQKLKQEAKETNTKISIQTTLNIGERLWRNSQKHDVKDGEVPMYVPDADYDGNGYVPDPKNYAAFRIFVFREPLGGGCIPNKKGNHCFYLSLQQLLGEAVMKKTFGTPLDFKDWLKIGKEDLVQIKHLKTIEDHLEEKNQKVHLYVSGDEQYVSQLEKKHTKRIDLILQNNHFTIDPNPMGIPRPKVRGGSREEKPLCVYQIKGDYVECYTQTVEGSPPSAGTPTPLRRLGRQEKQDGFIMTLEQKRQDRREPESAKYNYLHFQETKECPTMRQFYKKIKKANDEIVAATNGEINIISANGVRLAALKFYRRMNKLVLFEPITQNEQEWILEASTGALIGANCRYFGYGKEYDFISCYPSIMRDTNFLLPYKQGTFIRLDELPEKIEYGIYRAEVLAKSETKWTTRMIGAENYTYEEDEEVVVDSRKLFRTNPKNYYTHIDLKRARELGYYVELQKTEMGEPNALVYSRDKLVCGSEVFKKTIDCLYALKQKNILMAKMLINILWGGLCKYRRIEVRANDKRPATLNDSREVREISVVEQDVAAESGNPRRRQAAGATGEKREWLKADVVPKNSAFENNEARMKPFLLATARLKLSRVIEPFAEKVVRFHTDGFIVNCPNVKPEVGERLGDLKFVREDTVYVRNAKDVFWGEDDVEKAIIRDNTGVEIDIAKDGLTQEDFGDGLLDFEEHLVDIEDF